MPVNVLKKSCPASVAVLVTSLMSMSLQAGASAAESQVAPAKPVMAKICMNCHKPEGNTVVRGYLDGVSFKGKMLQVKLDDRVDVLNFDENAIQVVNEQRKAGNGRLLRDNLIKKGHEIRVEFTEAGGVKTAVKLTAKPPVQLAAEMLITTADLEKLVAQGPAKGKFFLFDSRPAPRFQEGAIPGAVNLPFPSFDKMAPALLPTDKNALLVFYCSGPACNMSPGSATKARKLGYTNLKVYRDGIPAWSAGNYTILSSQSLKEAWLDKDVSHVLLDVRSGNTNRHIPGAVAFPSAKAKGLVKRLDLKQKKAPIIVYDGSHGRDAAKVAKLLIAAGYGNVKMLSGGFRGWETSGFPVETGKIAARVIFEPKLKPGEVEPAAFKKYAESLPPTVAIVDVRLPSETAAGMLKNAIAIPLAELRDRVAEIPKDKTVIFQCNTGTQAEIAYNMMKELGFTNVKYLNAKVKFEKNGSYALSAD